MLPILNLALAAIPRWLLLSAAVAFFGASIALKVSNLNLQTEVAQHERRIAELKEGIASAHAMAAAQSQSFHEQARAAEQARSAREKSLANDARGARDELDGLRLAVAKANGDYGLRATTFAASLDYPDTIGELFLQCSERYISVAAKADGHANDTQTLIEAWPKSDVK